jgi:hypothetical protein
MQDPRLQKEMDVSPVDNKLFPKTGVHKETRNRKSRVNAILTDTAVQAALESEVKAHHKSAGQRLRWSGFKPANLGSKG